MNWIHKVGFRAESANPQKRIYILKSRIAPHLKQVGKAMGENRKPHALYIQENPCKIVFTGV